MTHRYKRSKEAALSNFSLQVHEGRTALLGPNGAGKTTLISILSGMAPSSGEVWWRGKKLQDRNSWLSYKRTLGYVPQFLTAPRSYTCEDFLRYAAWLKCLPKRDTAAGVAKALEVVNLESAADVPTHRLSGGQYRRLCLAQATMGQPGILLLDEPTAGLDPEQREVFYDILRRLPKSIPILFTTHLAEDVAALAERVALISGGHLIVDTTTRAFIDDDSPAATITTSSINNAFIQRLRTARTLTSGRG